MQFLLNFEQELVALEPLDVDAVNDMAKGILTRS